ncbi:MAG: hypothetical protein ACRCV7_01640 [Culicoidibacterales bacterium]
MRKIQLILHTHWDREWYFTKDETQVLLINHMQEVIEYLEKNSDVIYILDGQSVMLDDFLAFAPQWEERLKSVIQNQQLRVGPWYTQTDLLIVHGESIIRNLYYGLQRAEEFGEPMRIGYAPDTFGHNAQMPQIYSQFDIKSTFFWRGFSELKSQKSDFIWEGADGTQIIGVNLATGYQGAKYLESDIDELEKRLQKIMEVLDQYSHSEARLIMNGHDQMPIQLDIKQIQRHIKELYPDDNIQIGDFESYVSEIQNLQLDIVKGELNDSKHARIHRTINSTRMDIKLLNTTIEYRILNILEPLATKGIEYGFEYPHALMATCWKQLFGVHAHDSIGGCNSDKVNQDIRQRLLEVQETIDTQIELLLRKMALCHEKETGKSIIIFNPLPYKRKNQIVQLELLTDSANFSLHDESGNEISYIIRTQEHIDAGTIDRQVAARLLDTKVFRTQIDCCMPLIQGFSISSISCVEHDIKEKTEYKIQSAYFIENEYYRIHINSETKEVVLFHKSLQKEIAPLFYIESSGDAGDSYDYSPPEQDVVIKGGEIVVKRCSHSDICHLIEYDMILDLPKTQDERENYKNSTSQMFHITMKLNRGSKNIDLDITTKNKVSDTRFRLAVNQELEVPTIESDMQLSTIERSLVNAEPLNVWEKEKWAEKPVSIETFQSYIARYSKELKSAIFSYGHKEYEALGRFTYVTMYRSFSHLGKRNLINRPGRPSGIEIETPDNQLYNTELSMKFSLLYETSDENHFSKQAKEWLTPCIGYQVKKYNRFNINVPKQEIPKKQIEINLPLNNCVISCMKTTEKDDEIFIRLFNPTNEEIFLDFSSLDMGIYRSTMNEMKKNEITTLRLQPQEIINLILNIE